MFSKENSKWRSATLWSAQWLLSISGTIFLHDWLNRRHLADTDFERNLNLTKPKHAFGNHLYLHHHRSTSNYKFSSSLFSLIKLTVEGSDPCRILDLPMAESTVARPWTTPWNTQWLLQIWRCNNSIRHESWDIWHRQDSGYTHRRQHLLADGAD